MQSHQQSVSGRSNGQAQRQASDGSQTGSKSGQPDTSVFSRIRIPDALLDDVIREHLDAAKRHAQADSDNDPIHGRLFLMSPEKRTLARRYAFEGCAMSVLAFTAPDDEFTRALDACAPWGQGAARSAAAADSVTDRESILNQVHHLGEAACFAWLRELRASVFISSVDDAKVSATFSDEQPQFDVEARTLRFMNALF